VIDAICQWCVASAVLMIMMLTVNSVRAFGYTGSELQSSRGAASLAGSGSP
jgi:hypothetical protein